MSNVLPQDKREKAIELLATGKSIRAVAAEIGVHKNTIASLYETPARVGAAKHSKPLCSEGSKYRCGTDGLNKFQRYYARKKAAGGFATAICSDCGHPRHNYGGARCYNCYRRTAALKRLAKQHPEDSDEYEAGAIEIFQTTFKHPTSL